jgi:hypothetical protein
MLSTTITLGRRLVHTTKSSKDLRPHIKQLFNDHETKKKPWDIGTTLILGAPAVGCIGLYIWKQDTEILQPLRDAKKTKESSN